MGKGGSDGLDLGGDLFALMGMKKFSIMDKDKAESAAADAMAVEQGSPSNGPCIIVECIPAADATVVVRLRFAVHVQ